MSKKRVFPCTALETGQEEQLKKSTLFRHVLISGLAILPPCIPSLPHSWLNSGPHLVMPWEKCQGKDREREHIRYSRSSPRRLSRQIVKYCINNEFQACVLVQRVEDEAAWRIDTAARKNVDSRSERDEEKKRSLFEEVRAEFSGISRYFFPHVKAEEARMPKKL